MRNILSFCFALFISISFAQENSSMIIEVFDIDNKTGYTFKKIEGNQLLKFQEIVPINFEKKTNTNEGKFSLKEINNKSLTDLLAVLDNNTKTKFLIIEDVRASKENLTTKKSIIIVANRKFINKLITDKIIQDGLIAKTESYGDRSLGYNKMYPNLIDILNSKFVLSKNLELQIGDNIYSAINNPFKTELDKTLSNSLNLLAFNF